jgi:dTMP kinase
LRSGKFIVFEGGEGTGKSTQIRALEAWLKSQGREVIVTWEPGGTDLGQRIRAILLDPTSGPMDARCEALLYAAARAEHVAKVIRPALERGAVVLCDRYWDASRSYQGAGRRLGMGPIDRLNEWATQDLFPDRVFLFDLNPEAGLARAKARNHGMLDRLEQEGLPFHEQIRQAYLFIARGEPSRYRIMDASRAPESITAEVTEDVKSFLGK